MSSTSSREQIDELIHRALTGDSVALGRLLAFARPCMSAFLLRFRLPPQEVEDVLQEAQIKVWRGLASFRGEAAFTTWCNEVAKNVALNSLSKKRRRPKELSWEELQESNGQAAFTQASTDLDSPEELQWAKQRLQQVVNDVAALPAEQRFALELRYFQDADYEQIAAAQGVPIGTVRSRLHRARRAIGLDGD